MDEAKIEYVWKNYSHLIDKETNYLKLMRAALFPLNESWPDADEVQLLKQQYSIAQLTEKFQAIEESRELHVSSVCDKYSNEIRFNYCSNCGSLAIAPSSERCIKCGYTWYGTNVYRKKS